MALMVNAVTFWSFNDVPEPPRGADVRVLKQCIEAKEGSSEDPGFGLQTQQGIEDQARPSCEQSGVEWVGEVGAEGVEGLGRVVHLVHLLPQEITPVDRAVVPVVDELDR